MTVVEERNRLRHCFLEEESPDADEKNRDPAGNLGEVPVGANVSVFVRERMAQIGREATNRPHEGVKNLGRKIAEMERQGFAGKDKIEEMGRSSKASKQKAEQARSVNVPVKDTKGLVSVDVRYFLMNCM